MNSHSTKRRIRRALMNMSDQDAAMLFGSVLYRMQPVWRVRRAARARRAMERERAFTPMAFSNNIVRH